MDDTSITAHFGGDTTDLRRATKEAEIIVKGLNTSLGRTVGEIGAGFIGAVAIKEGIKAIKDLGEAAIDSAEKERTAFNQTGAAIDAQAQAWLDLKDGWSDASGGVKGYAISVLSVFPMMGSAIGSFINTLRGISPEAQKQFQDLDNSYNATMAKIGAANDKFVAELPAKLAAAGKRLGELTAQFEETQEDSGAKVANLYADQFTLVDQIAATKQVIATQEAAGIDTAATTLALTQQEADLEKNKLDIQRAQVSAARDYISSAMLSFQTKRETMTVEEQIVALTAQQASFERSAADASGNAKEQLEYKNAAARVGLQIEQDKREIARATAMSEGEVLAMYIAQRGPLSYLSGLSQEDLSIKQQISEQLKIQYAESQLLEKGVDNLTAAQKNQLDVLIQQGEQIKANIAALNQAKADAAVAEAMAHKPTGGGGRVGGDHGWDLGADAPTITTPILDDKGNPTGMWHTEDGSGSGGGFSGAGFPGTLNPQYNPGLVGVGFGNQQLQDSFTAKNNQSFVDSQIDALQKQIQSYENSDIKSYEDQVPALQKILAKLEQIHDGVIPALKGS